MKRGRSSSSASSEGFRIVRAVARQFQKASTVEVDANMRGRCLEYGQRGDTQIQELFEAVWKEMQALTSKARLCAVLLINDLFLRSVLFRKLVCGRLREYSELAIGIASSTKLLTDDGRGMLRTTACGFLHSWHERFVPSVIPAATTTYVRQLDMEFVYLRDKLGIAFVDVERERRQREEEAVELRRQVARRERSIRELAELAPVVESNLKELENLIALLFPSFEERFNESVEAVAICEAVDVPHDDGMEWEDEDEAGAHMQSEQHIGGLTDNFVIEVTLTIKNVNEDEERVPLVRTANDCLKILVRAHIPKLRNLMTILTAPPQAAIVQTLWNQSQAVLARTNKLLNI
jgi:hypothetical protein